MKSQFNFLKNTNLLKLGVSFFLLLSFAATAKERKWEQKISGSSVVNNAIIEIQDPEINTGTPYYYNASSATYVELKINDFTGPFFWYKCRVKVEITPYLEDGTLGTPYVKNLTVENNRYGNLGNFVDLHKHLVPNSRGARILIIDVETQNLDNNTYVTTTPDNISLTVSYETERYYDFSITNTSVLTLAENFLENNSLVSSNEVLVSWEEINGAEEYELAWTWVDNYGDDFDTEVPTNLISLSEKEFNGSCTRIQTSNLNYKIPLIYDNGYLVFRIRAIGRFWNIDYKKKQYGNWNIIPVIQNTKVADWGAQNIFKTNADPHSKNWQFQASYAENGKKKDVVSYFDGSLRNRQTVTKINTNEKVIVGEIIYDDEGRAAVEVLPVPSREPVLKFTNSFTRNLGEKLYSYQDFISPEGTICNTLAEGMSPEYQGASNYYSNLSDVQNNNQDFVPVANNYPFSQIEFTPDNTGRIKRKGGVGETYQLGTTHEMKYFYSVPSQEELNRLFGYSVGFASHYKKNIVIDPNKQISVSYIDPQGRTIATALSAESPTNMVPLDESATPLNTLVTDLLNKLHPNDPDSLLDNNERFSSGYYGELIDGLSYDAQKVFVNESTPYKFEYSLNKTPFEYGCFPHTYNYPFIYKLYRSIVDECGNKKMTETSELGTYSLDNDGNPELSRTPTSFSHQYEERLPVGAYGISKRLVVDGEALDIFTNDYIRRGIADGCILPPQAPDADLTGCYQTCEECENHYSSISFGNASIGKNSYVAMMLASDLAYQELNQGSPTYTQEAALFVKRYEREFELLIEACRKPCENDGYSIGGGGKLTSMNCDNSLNVVLSDMLPNGQYGVYPSDIDGEGDISQQDIAITNDYIATLKMSIYNEQNEIFAAAVGIDPSNVNWRHPHFFDKDGLFPAYGQPNYDNNQFKHYYNPNGEIDYVNTTWDEDTQTFTPPIQINGMPVLTPANLQPVNIVDVASGLYQVEPQHLANVHDFIQLIASREHWGMSLVKYHPEFHYLDYVYEMCKVTDTITVFNVDGNSGNEEIVLNSDGFDALIGSKKTFSEAVASGFLVNAFTLFDSDPYFNKVHPRDATVINITSTQDGVEVITPTTVTAADFLALKRSVMRHALGSFTGPDSNDPNSPGKFENSGYYMAYYIYRMIKCNGLDFSCQGSVANNFQAVINEVSSNFSEEEQDLFWTNYVAYYSSVKQKLQHVFLNMHAARQGFYNDCIGNNNRENFRRIVAVINGYPIQRNTAWSWIDGGEVPVHTLFTENGAWLKDKEKRFLPFDQTYQSDESFDNNYENLLGESNYYYLSTTGNCPILNDLAIFIDNAMRASAMKSVFNASGQNISFTGGYLTPALFRALGGNLPLTSTSVSFTGTTPSNPKILTLQCNQSFNTSLTPMTLELPGSSSYNWSTYGNVWDIVQIMQISRTGTSGSVHSFSFVAKIRNIATASLTEVVIKGTTQVVLTCTTAPGDVGSTDPVYIEPTEVANCTKKEDFTQALLALIENLRATGHLYDSDYDLLTNTTYTTGYLPEYFMTNPGVLYVRWKNTNVNGYTIRIGINGITSNEQMKLNLDLSQPLVSLLIGQLNGSNEYHIITAVDNDNNSISGLITGPDSFGMGTKHTPLKFVCCVPRNDTALMANRPFEDFLITLRNVSNELIAHAEQSVLNHTLTFDSDGFGTPTDVTFDYPLTSPNFAEFFSNYENPTWWDGYGIQRTPQGTYKLSFTFEGNATIGGGSTYEFEIGNLSQRVIEVNINEYYFHQYSTSESEVFSAGILNQPILLSDGTSGLTTVSTKHLKKFYFVPTCGCIPQAVAAVACPEKFALYQTFLTQYGIQNYITDPDHTAEEVFCGLNFQYIIDGYLQYLNALSITPQNYQTHPQYISLSAFGSSALGYGYSDYQAVIASFADYLQYISTDHKYLASNGIYYHSLETIPLGYDYELVDTWREYAAYYVFSLNLCPPKPLTPTLSIKVIPNFPCKKFVQDVNETYNAEAYEAYLTALKEAFRKKYLEEAIGAVVEKYNLTYDEKEYQYTLYYYDQAGNLIQTVAPEGVNKLNGQGNSVINQARFDHPEPGNLSLLPVHNFKTRYKYNSLNQLVWQSTPDGGETRFAYDDLGRIVASQNQKQSLLQIYRAPKLVTSSNVSVGIDGTITKGSTLPEGWNAGGATEKLIVGNGYVSWVLKEPYLLNANHMVGLSYNDSGIGYETINYGIYPYIDGGLIHVFENGTHALNTGISFAVGDKFKIERKNGVIYYYKNNTLLRSVAESAPGQPMLVDFSMHMNGHKIYDLEVGNYKTTNNFSYTCYDELGRIVEAGQFKANAQNNGIYINDDGRLVTASNSQVGVGSNDDYPRSISNGRIEVTRTLYDSYAPFNPDDYLTPQPIRNTRNRVTGILTFSEVGPSTELQDNETAIFYNYDIHGNVDEMVQRISPVIIPDSPSDGILKRVNYEYDLISGNVNKVIYQKDNQEDQFIHKYNYDADNRITDVQTSRDGVIWEKDAAYEYYDHGPLSRVVLGDKKVQGVDYAYTLQGWLKTVNSENLVNASKDMGKDGEYVSKDAYGYSLSYFNNDYLARHQGSNKAHSVSGTENYNANQLFNGNINKMITSVRGNEEQILPTQVNLYSYDQLNRIFGMDSFSVAESGNDNFDTEVSYSSNYTYDKNGNLQTLKRSAPKNGGGGVDDMDNLEYVYNPLTNKLDHLKDVVSSSAFNVDIDNQQANNYIYDEIGQLIEDKAENIKQINWRVDGKVKSVEKGNGFGIHFFYDGLGNRIIKKLTQDDKYQSATYYARDAQGNVLGVYSPDKDLKPLKEHHIYGSSRLGIQEYNNVIPDTDYYRLVGDKRYELSNHLGNVLNVITDRKIVSSKTNLDYSGFEYWKAFNTATVTTTNGHELTVTTSDVNAGAMVDLTFSQGQVVSFQLKVSTDDSGYNPIYPLLFNVYDSTTNTTVSSIPVPASGRISHSVTIEQSGNYRISVTVGADPIYPTTFHLDNFYAYTMSSSTTDFVSLFSPDVISYNDYYPFGMLVPNRHGSTDSYRYGFQGQEKDDEIKGEGNSLNYTFRMHDPRVGRFFAVDPIGQSFPWYSPYQFAGNNPIYAIELEGLEPMPSAENITKTKSTLKKYHGGFLTLAIQKSNNTSYASIWRVAQNLKPNNYVGALGVVGESRMAYEMYTLLQGLADVENVRGANIKVRVDFQEGFANDEGTWDIKTTVTSPQANTKTFLNFYDYDGTLNWFPEKYSNFTTLELIGEVKTISSNPKNVLSTVKMIQKGYEQAINNAKKNKSSGYDVKISVLIVDKGAYSKAYSKSPELMKSMYEKLRSEGGQLLLIPDLHSRSQAELNEILKEVKQNTTKEEVQKK